MGSANIFIWPSRFVFPVMLWITSAVCLWHLWRLVTDAKARDELTAVHIVDPDMEV